MVPLTSSPCPTHTSPLMWLKEEGQPQGAGVGLTVLQTVFNPPKTPQAVAPPKMPPCQFGTGIAGQKKS